MSGDLREIRAAAMRRDIACRLALCNLDESRVVDRVLQRLEVGRERYGGLDLSRPRNWRKERFEERLDALVYDVAEELAAEDVELAPLREDARRELVEWEAHRRTAIATESVELAPRGVADREPYDASDEIGEADAEVG